MTNCTNSNYDTPKKHAIVADSFYLATHSDYRVVSLDSRLNGQVRGKDSIF